MEQVDDLLSECQELGVRCYEPHPALSQLLFVCVVTNRTKKKNMIVWHACDKKSPAEGSGDCEVSVRCAPCLVGFVWFFDSMVLWTSVMFWKS